MPQHTAHNKKTSGIGTESGLMEHGETIELKEQNQRLITLPYTLLFLFNVYL